MIRFLSVIMAVLLSALPLRAEIAIQQVTSPSGIKAWLVEEHSIPFTALEISFKGGASLEAPEKRGATNLMMALLEEGTGDMDARAFAAAREALAASMSFDAGDDSVSISARFLSENRDEAMALLRGAIVAPNFDQTAIDRVREQVLSNLRSDDQDPGKLAAARFDALAFAGHPYATSRDGTQETVSALVRDDLIAVKNGSIALDRVYVGAVGDITAEELGVLLDTLLGDLPAVGASMPDHVDFGANGGVEIVEFNTPQSVAVFGHAGIKRDDDDFFPAFVMNRILGSGGFASRLTEEVREKRGLTYGIGTYLVPKEHAEFVFGQFASSNDRMAEAIDVVRSEWARMAQAGVTDQELEDAVTYLTGAYPLRFDGNGPIANILVGMQMQGLDVDYIATRNDKIRAVTREDIARVAAELLDPDALLFVVAGQPEGL
ncbi:M16 family metallopeptidase [Halocynthiibacter namhaensis]|uniref:M16 family metallopeptidase n=1 Tax=Halocynthiibacter namhaensis TaxID=1290553 RepID=UPI000578E865|nr:pitrilysin family protein [Halocynthiibacter namhaensis]